MFFGFSLAKLIVLAAIVALVWYGFKFFGRVDRVREEGRARRVREKRARGAARREGGGGGNDGAGRDDRDDVENMIKCPKCGAYVPARHPSACEREGCPYP